MYQRIISTHHIRCYVYYHFLIFDKCMLKLHNEANDITKYQVEVNNAFCKRIDSKYINL